MELCLLTALPLILSYSTMAIVNETSSGTNNMLLYVSVIGFAIISYVLYKFVLSPTQPADTQQRQQQGPDKEMIKLSEY